MRPLLANRKPEISYRNGFSEFSLSHSRTDIPCWFLAHGVVALSVMIHIALLLIFGRLCKTTLAERSPTSYLPSQIGRRRENFLGLSVMFLRQITMYKPNQWQRLTEQRHGADRPRRPLAPGFSFRSPYS